jgi:pimeloyl-ACP methyl ester carboxylesterase
MTTIFRSDAARNAMEASYERFRASIPDASDRVVTTRFGETHVLVVGRSDAPPLVLLPGALTTSAHLLSALTAQLDGFRVYALDIIGQSVKSADDRLPLDGPACGEWLVDVLDALGLASPHVYGVSWGGFLARKLAEYAPARIDRLVLVVPAGIVNGSVWTGLTKVTIPMLMYRFFPSRNRLLRFLGPIMTTLVAPWVDYFGEAFRSYRLDMRVPPLASRKALVGFTRRTLVFGASEDVFFPGPALLARAKVLFPQAELELLEGCRHMPPTNDDAFSSMSRIRIARFLRGQQGTGALPEQMGTAGAPLARSKLAAST